MSMAMASGILSLVLMAVDNDGGSSAGAVYVLFLDSDGNIIDAQKLSMLYGNLNTFYTLDAGDWFGTSVAELGDLDGDSIADLAAGIFLDDDGAADVGAAYILFLQTDGSIKNAQKLSVLYGGVSTFYTLESGDRFAVSLSGLGDVNGDSIEDLAVGANYDDDGGTNAGAAYLFFLQTDGTVEGAQKISMQYGGLSTFYTLEAGDMFGVGVTAPGDIDGDGVEDFAVGTYLDDDGGTEAGAVYVLFLDTNVDVKSAQKLSMLYGGISIFYTLDASDQFGNSVAALGDADGDGVMDLAVGSRQDYDGGASAGAAYLFFLTTDGTVKNAQKLSAIYGGFNTFYALETSDWFGISVAAAGDVDGDGVEDLVVGAFFDDDGSSGAGAVYIISLAQSYCKTYSPTMPPLPILSISPVPIPTLLSLPIRTVLPMPGPTSLPVPSPTFAPTLRPTLAPIPSPTIAPEPSPTLVPTLNPTVAPVPNPTIAPVPSPTFAPTLNPTIAPVPNPTIAPVPSPTFAPTLSPTIAPEPSPKFAPTISPTLAPASNPTRIPTPMPTSLPTLNPTESPVPSPTSLPTPNQTKFPIPIPRPLPMQSPTAVPVTTSTDTLLTYTYYHDDPTCTGNSYLTVATDIGVECSANATSCGFDGDMYFSATCSSEAASTLMPGKIGIASYSDTACSAGIQSVTAYTKDTCYYAGASSYTYTTVSSSGDVELYSTCSTSSCDDCVLSAA